jgi:hypothetical protein
LVADDVDDDDADDDDADDDDADADDDGGSVARPADELPAAQAD